jgi:hypothetical protein
MAKAAGMFFARAALVVSLTNLAATPAFSLCAASPMTGDWVAVNDATNGLTRARIDVGCCDQVRNGRPVCSPPDSVRIFGRCHPTDCDWGVRTGSFQTSNGLRLTYRQSFATRTVRIDAMANGNLRIRVFTDFASRKRDDYNMTEIMRPE